MKSIEPWQKGPLKILTEAIKHNKKGVDEDRFLSFLLLDVGMEMVLKTYLTLPKSFTGAITSDDDRFLASRKGFHDVIEAVKNSRQGISAHDLGRVTFFHGIRNKLYHQGNGITVPEEHVADYIDVTVRLTKNLLKIDIISFLTPNSLTEKEKNIINKCREEIDSNLLLAKELRAKLTENYELAAEKIMQDLVVPSFKKQFKEVIEKSLTEEDFDYNHETGEVTTFKVMSRNTCDRLKIVADLRKLCDSILMKSRHKELFFKDYEVNSWGSESEFKSRLGVKSVTVEHEVIPLVYEIAFANYMCLEEFYENLVNLAIHGNNHIAFSLSHIIYEVENFQHLRFEESEIDYWKYIKSNSLGQVEELRKINKDIEDWLES